MDIAQFVLKVFLFSTVLSVAIKYGGPLLAIPANATVGLVAVFLPSVLLAIALGWRALQPEK